MIVLQILLEVLFILLIYSAGFSIGLFIHSIICRYYKEWRYRRSMQKQEKEYEEYLQRKRRRELHKKEMEKYPLFYWRENAT